jgi:hypothetical protein
LWLLLTRPVRWCEVGFVEDDPEVLVAYLEPHAEALADWISTTELRTLPSCIVSKASSIWSMVMRSETNESRSGLLCL